MRSPNLLQVKTQASRATFFALTSLIFFLSPDAHGQGRRARFVGIQPGAFLEVAEPYYPIESFDVNIAPLMFETPINTVTDFKLTTIASYQIGPIRRIHAVGGQVVFPRFFKAKGRFSEKSQGWYAGPAIGCTRDFYRNHYAVSTALEWGGLTGPKHGLAAGINLQAGASYLIRLQGKNVFVPTLSFQVLFGGWIQKELVARGL